MKNNSKSKNIFFNLYLNECKIVASTSLIIFEHLENITSK